MKTYCLIATIETFPQASKILEKLHKEEIRIGNIYDGYDLRDDGSQAYRQIYGLGGHENPPIGCKKIPSDSWEIYSRRLAASILSKFNQEVDVYFLPLEFAVKLIKTFKFEYLDYEFPCLIEIKPQYTEVTDNYK